MSLVETIASCLRERAGGGLEFAESPIPVLSRLHGMSPDRRAIAVRELAEFGIFLERKKGSPEAAALLLETLESICQQLRHREGQG